MKSETLRRVSDFILFYRTDLLIRLSISRPESLSSVLLIYFPFEEIFFMAVSSQSMPINAARTTVRVR